jgi:hypothetical protein
MWLALNPRLRLPEAFLRATLVGFAILAARATSCPAQVLRFLPPAGSPQVNRFISRFGPRNFIKRGITVPQDILDSNSTDYVLRRIRELYVRDSTVTIVLIGQCTWARKFVDWELQASLRRPADGLPNGLIGILLNERIRPTLPPRFQLNRDSGYAKYHYYPPNVATLENWIEDAPKARVLRARLIRNPRERFTYNRRCP